LLAERLIEIAHRGERDRQRLVAEALAQFSDSN
jgi:predicted transcriptional regulator